MKGGFLEHSDGALSLALSPDAQRCRKGHWKALEKISHSLTHFLSLLFSLQKVPGEGQSHTTQLGQGLPSVGFSAEEKVSSSCSGFSILDVRKTETTEHVEHFFIFWRTGAVSRPKECEAVLGCDGTPRLQGYRNHQVWRGTYRGNQTHHQHPLAVFRCSIPNLYHSRKIRGRHAVLQASSS